MRLERERLLHHAHFSAFPPVAGTPFEGAAATPAAREARLYQAERLMRDHGFRFEELVFDRAGILPLDDDPKIAWALAHAAHFPLAIETASLERAGYFLTLRGQRLAASPPAPQLRLFAHGEHLAKAAFKTSVPPCAYR